MRELLSPEKIERTALLAVELIDPVTLELVSRGVTLEANVLVGKPVINYSGRFVWFAEGINRPNAFRFDPGQLPYQPHTFQGDDLANLNRTNTLERVLRFSLQPTFAYPFTEGVTVLRGSLHETADPNAASVKDAKVWLSVQTSRAVVEGSKVATDEDGNFACFVRLPKGARPNLDEKQKMTVTLKVERTGPVRTKTQAVIEGHIFDMTEALAWDLLSIT